MILSEKSLGEEFAYLGGDSTPFDGQPLLAFGAIDGDLFFGEGGVQQDLFGELEGGGEELFEATERDDGIIAIDVDVVIGAVEIDFFGDLLGCQVLSPFTEQVECGRGDERSRLVCRSGCKYETDAEYLLTGCADMVESDTVGKFRSGGDRQIDLSGNYDGWLETFHAFPIS